MSELLVSKNEVLRIIKTCYRCAEHTDGKPWALLRNYNPEDEIEKLPTFSEESLIKPIDPKDPEYPLPMQLVKRKDKYGVIKVGPVYFVPLYQVINLILKEDILN